MAARVLSWAMVPLIASQAVTGVMPSMPFGEHAKPPGIQAQGSDREQALAEAAKLDSQVVKLYQEGKYEAAISPAKRALKIREKLLKPNDPLLADSAGNVAALYMARQKFDDAESFLKRALLIYESNPAGNALLIAKTLESLGQVRSARNDPTKAEEFYLRALSIKENALAANHEEIFLSLNRLVEFYDRGKQPTKAISLLNRLISIKEQSGRSYKDVGLLLERMSCLMHRNNQTAEAETTEARANHILYGAQANAAKPIPLSNEVFACKLINNPRPDLRAAIRGRPPVGSIKMEVAVETDDQGNVIAANYIGADPAYKSVAETAALKSKVRPTIVDGRAVRVAGVIVHKFFTEVRLITVPITVRQ